MPEGIPPTAGEDGPFRAVERLVFIDDDVAPELITPHIATPPAVPQLPRAVRFTPSRRVAPWQPAVAAPPPPAADAPPTGSVAAVVRALLLTALIAGLVAVALLMLANGAHHRGPSQSPASPPPAHHHRR